MKAFLSKKMKLLTLTNSMETLLWMMMRWFNSKVILKRKKLLWKSLLTRIFLILMITSSK